MMKTVLLLYLILELSKIKSNAIYKNCSLHDAQESCPINAECSEESNHKHICKCDPDYIFNPNYKNLNEYCVFSPVTLSTIKSSSSSSSSNSMNKNKNKISGADSKSIINENLNSNDVLSSSSSTSQDKTASAIAMNQPPNSHHIIGGILIPIFLVLVIIGLAYGIKRLSIIKRVRDIMISRRNRPFYEDVMMSNDNDDPPLI